jgi:hypothetical protein
VPGALDHLTIAPTVRLGSLRATKPCVFLPPAPEWIRICGSGGAKLENFDFSLLKKMDYFRTGLQKKWIFLAPAPAALRLKFPTLV